MRKLLIAALLCGTPALAMAQESGAAGPTQNREGLATSDTGKITSNGAPAGSVNATTGPQSRPAYPSGSTTANPGAAFVRTMPKPASGTLAKPPGVLSTTTVGGGGVTKRPAAQGVGQAARPPQ